MFTGLIECTARVVSLKHKGGISVLTVGLEKQLQDIKRGDSLAVNGICLTVVEIKNNYMSFELLDETFKVTTLQYLKSKDVVNIERALASGGRVGGHFVSGHIDTTGIIVSIVPSNKSYIFKIRVAPGFIRYLPEKASVSVDGISLTVVSCVKDIFRMDVLPYTHENTRLKTLKAGDRVNVEFDIMAKYAEKLLSSGKYREDHKEINADFLKDHGF